MLVVIARHARPSRCLCRKALARAKATLAPAYQDMEEPATLPALASFGNALGLGPELPHSRGVEGKIEAAGGGGGCPFSRLEESPLDTSVETTLVTPALKSFDEIPGPRGFPMVGNALKYTKFGKFTYIFKHFDRQIVLALFVIRSIRAVEF